MARPRVHLLVTALAVGLLRRRLTGPERVAALATGVLVDADHLVDLLLYRCAGRRRWVVLPLHGWEYGAALLLSSRATRWPGPARAAALGLLLHLLLDQATNQPAHPAFYSLLYRLRHRFAADQLRLGGGGDWVHQRWWQWL
jgi:hypothetical protein